MKLPDIILCEMASVSDGAINSSVFSSFGLRLILLGIGKSDNNLQIVSSSAGCEIISISSLVEVLGNSISAFDHCTF